MLDILNRPTILLALVAAAAVVGFLARRARGAIMGPLVLAALLGGLLAFQAFRFGLPDAGGWFALGLAVMIGCAALAWRLR